MMMLPSIWITATVLVALVGSTNASFRPRFTAHISSSPALLPAFSKAALLTRGGDDLEFATGAFDWCANLGAPAALVGGAVLATLVETRPDLAPRRSDTRLRRLVKLGTRYLLLSAFALEIISIFATTVTGTMLMAQGDRPTGSDAGLIYHSPMGFLHHNHEFEYLTARVTFLQGLFHWLAATALELVIPKPEEGQTAKRMNAFISSSLVTIIFLMLSFYNAHMSFYDNYAHMMWKYLTVCAKRFCNPGRPLFYVYTPFFIYTLVLGYRAFSSPSAMDLEDDDEK